jgi:hypothetical protein
MLALALVPLLFTQTPGPAPALASPPMATSAEERSAAAAEKAAAAAEKAANAVELLASELKPAAPPPLCAPPPPPPEVMPPPYDLTLGVGLLSMTGNTESVSANVNAAGDYRKGDWVFSSKLTATYGQSRATPGAPSTTLAEAGAFQIRADRRFGELVAAYALAGTDTDHIKSVEYDIIGEVGLSLFWWDHKYDDGSLTYFRTDVGLRADQQQRFQYFPTPEALAGVTLVGPHLGLEFRKGLTKDLFFLQTGDVTTNIDGPTRTLVTTLTKLSVHLVGSLAVGASFAINYDSAPAQGKLPTDTTLAITLDYKI